jgi:acyl carrier protein
MPRSDTPEPIAIVGIGCRFPGGAGDPRAFWELVAASARFSHLAAGTDDGGEAAGAASILERVWAAPADRRCQIVEGALREQLAAVLGTSAGKVGTDQKLAALGLDSLLAVELSYRIENHFGVRKPSHELMQLATISTLAAQLLGHIEAGR